MPTLGSGTDTPVGPSVSDEDIYVEGGPFVWFQGANADEANNPDGDDFYWGLSGTATYPVYELGCYDDISKSENRTENAVRCASLGDVAIMQKRDSFEINLTLKSLLPLDKLRALIDGGPVTINAGEEASKMGVGTLTQNQYYHVFMSRVYDDDVGDYVSMTFHKVQFVGAPQLSMEYAQAWQYTIRMLVLADTTMPAKQRFYTMIRWDPSIL